MGCDRGSFFGPPRLGLLLCALWLVGCAQGGATFSAGSGGLDGSADPVTAGDAGDSGATSGGGDTGDGGSGDGGSGDSGSSVGSDGGAGTGGDSSTSGSNGSDAGTTSSGDAAATSTGDAGGTSTGPVDPGEKPGDFPRAGEHFAPGLLGEYAISSYSAGLEHPTGEYASAVVTYPTNASAPFAAVVFCPDTGSTWEDNLNWWAASLASQGIVVMGIDPARPDLDGVPERADDLQAAVAILAEENARPGSPLQGKLARFRIAVAGHGTGGAAALTVAQRGQAAIRAVLALQPRQRTVTFPNIDVPTLILTGQNDPATEDGKRYYDAIPAGVEKIFAEYAGADATLSTNQNTQLQQLLQIRYVLPFLKLFLEDNPQSEDALFGAAANTGAMSVYQTSRD